MFTLKALLPVFMVTAVLLPGRPANARTFRIGAGYNWNLVQLHYQGTDAPYDIVSSKTTSSGVSILFEMEVIEDIEVQVDLGADVICHRMDYGIWGNETLGSFLLHVEMTPRYMLYKWEYADIFAGCLLGGNLAPYLKSWDELYLIPVGSIGANFGFHILDRSQYVPKILVEYRPVFMIAPELGAGGVSDKGMLMQKFRVGILF